MLWTNRNKFIISNSIQDVISCISRDCQTYKHGNLSFQKQTRMDQRLCRCWWLLCFNFNLLSFSKVSIRWKDILLTNLFLTSLTFYNWAPRTFCNCLKCFVKLSSTWCPSTYILHLWAYVMFIIKLSKI